MTRDMTLARPAHPPTARAAVLIAGPTASGKSALALALAERLNGVVINADSMQVYRELAVLTARPTPAEEARAPHLLYGHVPAHEAYSAGRFVREAGQAIADVRRRGQVPIIVGGTGLYFKALTEGLAAIPPVPAAIRAHWRARAAEIGAARLHEELAARDPAMANRLAPTDLQRITRALEVWEATSRSLADWQAMAATPTPGLERALRLVVEVDRGELYRRCNERFAAMVEAGAREEVRALLALGLDPGLPAMRALGVRPLAAAIRGEIGLEAAVAGGAGETRQYAKRQLTWLRRNMIAWNIVPSQEIERMLATILPFIDFSR